MNVYEIVLRGEEGNAVTRVPLGFPCITCHIINKKKDVYDRNFYRLTWSNAANQTGKNPGKFTLSRIEKDAETFYVKDTANNRVMKDKKGRVITDPLELNKRNPCIVEGTNTLVGGNVEDDTDVLYKIENETVAGCLETLTKKFGEGFALQVMSEMTRHELYGTIKQKKAA